MNADKTAMDLRRIFLGLQSQMIAALESQTSTIRHNITQGAASELQWLAMLSAYLPQRYCADSGFVVDCDGQVSDQIDVVIYDRQYSPFLFHEGGAKYVPAESVYAVFEVKPYVAGPEVIYAGKKAASVRRLRRTSAAIPHAGGLYDPKPPPRILAGLLALDGRRKRPINKAFRRELLTPDPNAHLDLGCVLQQGAFHVQRPPDGAPVVEFAPRDTALIFFFLKLLSRLQAMGTVAALDFDEYSKVL